ncbi:hypothetical protein GCM10010129_17820 [Streptomyces fumigatiscleroticus]|nr:hypothetical protein GCM10010129_17820 [Streptomyces fumigatiscleroticus]
MIVPPRLLDELLDQVDRRRAAHLALDFTQHLLEVQRDEVEVPVRAVCLEYIAAAREAIDRGEATPRLLRAHERLYEVAARSEGTRHFLARGAEPTVQAVRVGCQRMLEGTGAVNMRMSYQLTCQDIARDIQSEMGRWCAERIGEDGDRGRAARAARWEEARRQVQHVIATEPFPYGSLDGRRFSMP